MEEEKEVCHLTSKKIKLELKYLKSRRKKRTSETDAVIHYPTGILRKEDDIITIISGWPG